MCCVNFSGVNLEPSQTSRKELLQKQTRVFCCWMFLLRAPSCVFELVLFAPLIYDRLFLWNFLAQPFLALLIMPQLIFLLQYYIDWWVFSGTIIAVKSILSTTVTIAMVIFDIANVFYSCIVPNVESILNNCSNLRANIMLWYNIQEYFHHVFMPLQLILKSPLILSNWFSFYITFSMNRIDIVTQKCSGN